jgi:hypothetical protein
MLIGQDFEPVKFKLFGIDLIEPNALIGDTFIGLLSFFLAFKTIQLIKQNNGHKEFFIYWKYFFIIFGFSFLAGGLGHSCYNFWGPPGKYFGWLASIVCVYLIEQSMLSLYSKEKPKLLFLKLSRLKLIFALAVEVSVFVFADLYADPQKGLAVPSVTSAIGFITCLLILGWQYQKSITNGFKWFWISVLTMIPTAVFQGMKISIHPLFDRNDMSHILLVVSLVMYWIGIKAFNKHLQSKSHS